MPKKKQNAIQVQSVKRMMEQTSATCVCATETELWGDATELWGDATELWGDATELWGDATELWGDATELGRREWQQPLLHVMNAKDSPLTRSELRGESALKAAHPQIELNRLRAVEGQCDGGDAASVGKVVQVHLRATPPEDVARIAAQHLTAQTHSLNALPRSLSRLGSRATKTARAAKLCNNMTSRPNRCESDHALSNSSTMTRSFYLLELWGFVV
jgi:hypothetical protein